MRIRIAAVVALAASCAAVPTALAHQGNPNYLSQVDRITPAVSGVTVDVLNRDDRLLLHNTSGEDVVIEGYNEEPYARVLADGTVQVNTDSQAYAPDADDLYSPLALPRSRGETPGPSPRMAPCAPMSVTRLLSEPARCPACGRGWVPKGWAVVDLEERPNLRAALADDTWRTWRCPGCDAAIERRAPLLLLQLSPEAPVVLGVSDEELLADNPIEPHRELLDRTLEALGIRRHDIPGPVVAAPFDVLAFAATRDVAADVAADPQLPDAPTETARRYRNFLQILRDSRPARRINVALARLLTLRSAEDVRAAFAEAPELRARAVRERLEQELALAGDAEERHIAQARLDLVVTASTGRFDEAWSGYERALLELSEHHFGPRLMALLDQLRAEEGGDPARGIELGEQVLAQLHGLGPSGVRVETLLRTAAAYYNAEGPDVEDRLDRAIVFCKEALDVLAAGVDDDDPEAIEHWQTEALVNLSAAYARRYRGDPVANHERACEAARQVLDRVSFESNPRVWAMVKTNLAMSLVHRAKERSQDDPEREAELAEALALFGDALRWRSFERDPLDWSYTQMGLGLAYGHRRGADRLGDLRASIEHHRASARGLHAAGARTLEAQAWHNVASEAIMLAALDDIPATERAELIAHAEEACARSLSLRPDEIDPIGAGATRGVLGRALELRNDPAAAMATHRQALAGYGPTSRRTPRDGRRSSSHSWRSATATTRRPPTPTTSPPRRPLQPWRAEPTRRGGSRSSSAASTSSGGRPARCCRQGACGARWRCSSRVAAASLRSGCVATPRVTR